MDKLDEINCHIMNLLQVDCRMSLTEIAKKVGLSVDSVKKRIDKMKKHGYYHPKVQIRPRILGYPYIVDIKAKLHNLNSNNKKEFIDYLMNHPRVAELISISGRWDFTIVLIAKDHEELGELTGKIRDKFGDIISDWSESLTTIVHKFEKYDLIKLKGYDKNKSI